ncbi:hypothetical protein DFJ77DRAFT_506092 [Powellomyces hirtus]|nr:hypothetical protein DFJ77DRAFT_506092 [Powellomyces hirtus]
MPSSLASGYFPVQQPPSSSVAAPFLLKPHANGTRTLLTHLHFCVELYPDDAKDKVFLAIVKALLRGGNKPCTPKELSNLILKHKLTTLGGATPYATVSSRISQHFKRATDLNRSPLLGRRSLDQRNSRRLVYYVDQVGVPVNPGSDGDRAHSESDDSGNEAGGEHMSSGYSSHMATTSSPTTTEAKENERESSHSAEDDSSPGGTNPTTPLRVSTRVKRRRSPYSPPADEPQVLVKRSRSSSFSNSAILMPLRRGIEKNASASANIAEATRAENEPSSASDSAGVEQNGNTATDISAEHTAAPSGERDFHEDMMKVDTIPKQPHTAQHGTHTSSHSRPHPHQQSSSHHLQHSSLHQQQQHPHDPQPSSDLMSTLRRRTTSDDFVLQPITASPGIRPIPTLPSQLSSLSQPDLDFDASKEFLPPPFLDTEAEHASDAGVSHSYPMTSGLQTFDGGGLGVYHEFHHPENVSVSELDFLLGDGGDEGWGLANTQVPVVPVFKRAVTATVDDSAERELKRRKTTSEPDETRQGSTDSNTVSLSSESTQSPPAGVNAPSALPLSTSTEPVSSLPLTPPGDDARPVTSTLMDVTPPAASTMPTTMSGTTTPAPPVLLPASLEPAPLSMSSYRCNGGTLEVYEKVAHDSMSVRTSKKIKSAPRLDMIMRILHVDLAGRVVPTSHTDSDDVKVGVFMQGYVRAKELFESGSKTAMAVDEPRDDEVVVKTEETVEPADELVWNAYVEELRRRAIGPRHANESSALKICGRGGQDGGHVLVELKGSDVEGENGVPVECGGVWIPTVEARRLATTLGISDRLAELFLTGPDSTSDIKPLPSTLTLTSPTYSSFLATPIRPSTLSLPSPASTPVLKIGSDKKPTKDTGLVSAAVLDEEVKHDDFLVFEPQGAGWSQEADGTASGDDGAAPSSSSSAPTSPVTDTASAQLPPPVSIDPSTLHLVPPVQPIAGGGPMYMTNIDGILCYIMWLVKSADGTFVGTPAKEVGNPFEAAKDAGVAAPAAVGAVSTSTAATPTITPTAATTTNTAPTESQHTVPATTTVTPAPVATAITTPATPSSPPVPLLRRVDNNMVNATLLLHAGGLVTDKERSIVLSLERGRARCRKKGSGLYGTWIPLTRARHLARTFCLQGKLGGFLGDAVSKTAFGIGDGVASGGGVPTSSAVGKSIGPDGSVVYKEGAGATAGSGSALGSPATPLFAQPSATVEALAANKAALLGLTSLPPNVASGLATMGSTTTPNTNNSSANDQTTVRGLLASAARGRAGARGVTGAGARSSIRSHSALANAPISGRSFMGGRVGSGLYGTSTTTAAPMSVTGTTATTHTGATPTSAAATSSAMAATQAAIAALTKLGGSGPLTAATLASALAALNQVNAQVGNKGNGGAGSSSSSSSSSSATTTTTTTTGAASIPSPASILQAFASVFKNGFGANWKPVTTATTTTSTTTPTTNTVPGSSSGTTLYNPSTTSGALNLGSVGQHVRLDTKPNVAALASLSSSSSSTSSSAAAGIPTLTTSASAALPTSMPTTSIATQGVVARALAAAAATQQARAGNGLTKSGGPVSIQTHALAGLQQSSNLAGSTNLAAGFGMMGMTYNHHNHNPNPVTTAVLGNSAGVSNNSSSSSKLSNMGGNGPAATPAGQHTAMTTLLAASALSGANANANANAVQGAAKGVQSGSMGAVGDNKNSNSSNSVMNMNSSSNHGGGSGILVAATGPNASPSTPTAVTSANSIHLPSSVASSVLPNLRSGHTSHAGNTVTTHSLNASTSTTNNSASLPPLLPPTVPPLIAIDDIDGGDAMDGVPIPIASPRALAAAAAAAGVGVVVPLGMPVVVVDVGGEEEEEDLDHIEAVCEDSEDGDSEEEEEEVHDEDVEEEEEEEDGFDEDESGVEEEELEEAATEDDNSDDSDEFDQDEATTSLHHHHHHQQQQQQQHMGGGKVRPVVPPALPPAPLLRVASQRPLPAKGGGQAKAKAATTTVKQQQQQQQRAIAAAGKKTKKKKGVAVDGGGGAAATTASRMGMGTKGVKAKGGKKTRTITTTTTTSGSTSTSAAGVSASGTAEPSAMASPGATATKKKGAPGSTKKSGAAAATAAGAGANGKGPGKGKGKGKGKGQGQGRGGGDASASASAGGEKVVGPTKEEEESDFEIDVCDGDGVDDFR